MPNERTPARTCTLSGCVVSGPTWPALGSSRISSLNKRARRSPARRAGVVVRETADASWRWPRFAVAKERPPRGDRPRGSRAGTARTRAGRRTKAARRAAIRVRTRGCPGPVRPASAGGLERGTEAGRQGEAVPQPLPGPRGRLPDQVRQQENGKARLRARMLEQVRRRRLRIAAGGQVRRLLETSLLSRRRRDRRRAPDWSARDGRLPIARRRDLLVPRGRLRQERRGRRTSRPSPRRARVPVYPPRSSARGRETALTFGFSSRHP